MVDGTVGRDPVFFQYTHEDNWHTVRAIVTVRPGLTKLRFWQATRGARSGRVAWQYFADLAGRNGIRI